MRIQKNIIVLDTETTGDLGSPIIYDLGYCVLYADDLSIKKCYRSLVKEIFENRFLMNNDFYKAHKTQYEKDIETTSVEMKNWLEIVDDLKADIRSYNVKTICAYNVAFDKKALATTCSLLHGNIQKINYACIWNMACNTIMQSDDYRLWAKENGKFSQCGNMLTNAETCFQFLTRDDSFIESHTALDDSIIESAILKYIIENYKGTTEYGEKYGCWRKAQEKK